MNAVILCGGLGTRLGSLTRETPKPLLEVAGKPFISHVLEQLHHSGVTRACLAVSFQWHKLKTVLGDSWQGFPLSYSVEAKPLGTGGAIRQAMLQMGWSEAIVANGDTLVDVDLKAMVSHSSLCSADIVLALKQVADTARFGRVNINSVTRVESFSEKGVAGPGLINAGVYWLRGSSLSQCPQDVFSFEHDLMAAQLAELQIYGKITEGYFIDMGIPEDLARARRELLVGPSDP
ncbi:MAG: nucleotidyltransferase family protein [Cyanobacteriota bacterium]